MFNKGKRKKFKGVRLRSRVGLACWPHSPVFKVFYVESEQGALQCDPCGQSVSMGSETRDAGIFTVLNDCQMSWDDQQATAGPLIWKKATVCRLTDNGKILNTSSSVKPVLGHLFLLHLPGSESGKGGGCCVSAVFIAQCLWEKMFSALHRASILPVCCLLLLLFSVAIPILNPLCEYLLKPAWLAVLRSLPSTFPLCPNQL